MLSHAYGRVPALRCTGMAARGTFDVQSNNVYGSKLLGTGPAQGGGELKSVTNTVSPLEEV